ncbi:hypothetical protein CcCBS67573_g10370 [Chytriomyces confervae]|uniref:Uncharacterized protein n=1 Tax=Chytriomyces confervae TaxID=246404 RepID=A0A507D1N0_9FUNG|nr:hypothetical protein CcCBS67573_g10370 [Chytriomyces confervae]
MVTHSDDYKFVCTIGDCKSKFRRNQDLLVWKFLFVFLTSIAHPPNKIPATPQESEALATPSPKQGTQQLMHSRRCDVQIIIRNKRK